MGYPRPNLFPNSGSAQQYRVQVDTADGEQDLPRWQQAIRFRIRIAKGDVRSHQRL